MNDTQDDYQWLCQTSSGEHWKKIGAQRRAGVATPLFSLYSQKSIGIGELPDLKILIDWCRQTGLSIIQLLPLNDVGFQFTPYDSKSSFALEPMYMRLEDLLETDTATFSELIAEARKQFPCGKSSRVNYAVKAAKLGVLWKIFSAWKSGKSQAFAAFQAENAYWLDDYALFNHIKFVHEQKAWWEWPEGLRSKNESACQEFIQDYSQELLFQKWLQWQLHAQLAGVKAHAQTCRVLLMGDLPFLVSKDSADVWSRQDYFKLNLVAGAPPDMYFAAGQRWGMPPYHWDKIASEGYQYLIQKLKYSEHFYDLFRIDHFVGMFRLWTIPADAPENTGGLHGAFDPREEFYWEEHGKRLLNVMLSNTSMLPCAEDLGTVPDCSYKVIREYGIVGMDIQRWQRDWGKTYDFKANAAYRPNAIAAASTHDALDIRGWWEYETGTVDELFFEKKCRDLGLDSSGLIPRLFDLQKSPAGRLRWQKSFQSPEDLLPCLERPPEQVGGILDMFRETVHEREQFWKHLGLQGKVEKKMTPELALKIMENINQTVSIFSIQLLQDWLAMGGIWGHKDARKVRINQPGTVSDKNWSVVLPLSLEDMLALKMNADIRSLCRQTRRLV